MHIFVRRLGLGGLSGGGVSAGLVLLQLFGGERGCIVVVVSERGSVPVRP